MAQPYRIELLGPNHDREAFSCGVEPLDRYFKKQASQDVRRRATVCFVAAEVESGQVAGCYTLAASSILLADLPTDHVKRLPRYPQVPVARLGRLAVDLTFRGRKLGAALLWDAIERCIRSDIALHALVVDAKDHDAAAFYRRHGFASFAGQPRQLFLPLANLK
jgi:ribosomal protein S18 acetylase RimI-like enzyme